ncbi:MAG: hypothetical protein ACLRVB_11540 [Blautia sp.]
MRSVMWLVAFSAEEGMATDISRFIETLYGAVLLDGRLRRRQPHYLHL